jgi:hypothetical protein
MYIRRLVSKLLNCILLLIKEAHIYIYVCSHFFNPLTPLFKARFYLYLHTTARDFQSKWTVGPWHQSITLRAPVSWVYYFHILKAVEGPIIAFVMDHDQFEWKFQVGGGGVLLLVTQTEPFLLGLGQITGVVMVAITSYYSRTPIYRAPIYRVPRFTGLIPFPPRGPVNRGFTV